MTIQNITKFFSQNNNTISSEKQKLVSLISKINRNTEPVGIAELKANITSPQEFAYVLSQIAQEKATAIFSTLAPHVNLNKQNRNTMISELHLVLEKSNSKLTILTGLIQTPQVKAIDMILPPNEITPLFR